MYIQIKYILSGSIRLRGYNVHTNKIHFVRLNPAPRLQNYKTLHYKIQYTKQMKMKYM